MATPADHGRLDLSSYGRGMLAGAPDAAVVIMDADLRIVFTGGEGISSTVRGRLLPDVVSETLWEALRSPIERAFTGVSSGLDVMFQQRLITVEVSPLIEDDQVVGVIAASRTVGEKQRSEFLIQESEAVTRSLERLLVKAFDRSPIGMTVTDLDGRPLRVNPEFCALLGYTSEELLSNPQLVVLHPEDAALDAQWVRDAEGGETDSMQRDKRLFTRDGATVWVAARAEIVRDDDGAASFVVIMVQDITARRGADLALRASELRLRAIIDNSPNAVAVQGHDHRYQMVNCAFAQRFGLEPKAMVGKRDDEIPGVSRSALDDASHDRVMATGTPDEFEEPDTLDDADGVLRTVKFALHDDLGEIYGVCTIVTDITDRSRRARDLQERLEWTERIHSAVTENRLVLYAQPIIDLATRRVHQAELLVRMIDREGRLVPPIEFLPSAERFGLITVIDQWVVSQAIELARHHRVEVNLSGVTISNPEHVALIERQVIESGVPPDNIVFEITETAVVENVDSARRFAQRLRALGCRFALDDFGVGFGTFTYLRHLPVDYLKIDIEFVRDVVRDEGDRQVVTAIVGVARDFEMKTIAEGVEDEATLDLLSELGVDDAQGYWIGRPIPVGELWPATQILRGPDDPDS